jgi:hypothetical protein
MLKLLYLFIVLNILLFFLIYCESCHWITDNPQREKAMEHVAEEFADDAAEAALR